MKKQKILTSILFAFLIISLIPSNGLSLEGRPFHPIPLAEKPDEGAKEIEISGIKLPPLPTRKTCISLTRQVAASYGSGQLAQFMVSDFPDAHYLLDTFQRISMTAQRIELQVQSVENVYIEPWKILKKDEKDGELEYLLRSECVAQVRTRVHFVDSATGNRIVRTFGHGKWHFGFFVSESGSDDGNKTTHLHHLSPGNGVDMPDGSKGALLHVQSEDTEGALFEPDIVENFIFIP